MVQIGGLEIPLSTRGITGLDGVSYTRKGHPQRPYVASMNRREVDSLTNGQLGLDRSAYGYGGDAFHIGYFNDPRRAAWVRADFKNNPTPYIKAFQANRQQGGRGNLADLYQPSSPSDLDNIPLQPISDAAREYEAVLKSGGSEAQAVASAERKRQENLAHVQRAQTQNQAQDRAIELTGPGGALHKIFSSIPVGPYRGKAIEYITSELADGAKIDQIKSDLTAGFYNESSDIKRLRVLSGIHNPE